MKSGDQKDHRIPAVINLLTIVCYAELYDSSIDRKSAIGKSLLRHIPFSTRRIHPRAKVSLAVVEIQADKQKSSTSHSSRNTTPPTAFSCSFQSVKELAPSQGKTKSVHMSFLIAVKGMQKMNFGWEKRTLSEVSASLAAEKREESFASITRFWTESNGKGILSKRISMTNGSRISKKGASVWAIRFIYANPIIATP